MANPTSDSRRRRLGAYVLSACLLLPASAAAKDGPSDIDRDAARTLVQQGDAKVEEGNFRAALEAYRRADDIMGVPTTAIEVARMHQELGELVAAYGAYQRAVQYPERKGEPAPFTQARQKATKLIDELKPRIPHLELDVDGVPPELDVEVTIDQEVVEAWGRRFPIDPGPHELMITAEGYEPHAETFVLDEGSERKIDVVLEALPNSGVGKTDESANLWPLAITGFSLAGLGLVAGSVAGGLHLSDASTLKDVCPDGVCPPSERGTFDRSRVLAHVSTASFALAGVGAALGVVGLVLSLDEGEKSDEASMMLTFGVGTVGLGGRF